MTKTAYFDCFSGAAGDMIVAACLDAGANEDFLRSELAKLSLKEVKEIKIEKVNKNGIAATSFLPELISHNHSHGHSHNRTLKEITDIINQAGLSDSVRQKAIEIFQHLGRAEAKVHGCSNDHIHFHEVGAADAIIDIVGACLAMETMGIEKTYCSALTLGNGTIKSAHGILPVPAPATAELIKNIDIRPTDVQGELLTPTGAAILTHLADNFGPMPPMTVTDIGYGAGQRDIPGMANVLRLMVGKTDQPTNAQQDQVWVLQANIDDATAELIAHVTDTLLNEGALDVFCTAITMKKGRPATQLSVICSQEQLTKLQNLLFIESTTFGVRRYLCSRTILKREHKTVQTPFGPIRIKLAFLHDDHPTTCSAEFSDCQQAAKKHNVPVKKVIAAAMTVYNCQSNIGGI